MRVIGPALSPHRGWTRSLALWSLTAINTIGVLCGEHTGPAHADALPLSSAGTRQAEIDLAEGLRQRKLGHYLEASAAFSRAAQNAHTSQAPALEARALLLTGGCQIRLFQYRSALRSLDQSQQLALKAHDRSLAGAAATNQSNIYAELGDFSLADEKARQGVELLQGSNRPDYLGRAFLRYADIEAQEGKLAAATDLYKKTLSLGHAAGLADVETLAQLHLGEALLDSDNFQDAGRAFAQAEQGFTKTGNVDSVAVTEADLAELNYRERNYEQALQLVDHAIYSHHLLTLSPYLVPHLRGQILLAMGRPWDALVEFRKAANQASLWRQGALPGDATSIRTVTYLHQVYQDFTELAASLAVKTYNTALARETLEVLSNSRAASLREQTALALQRKGTLPPEYFQLLSELQAAQAASTLEPSRENQAKLEQIRSEFSEQENKLGINSGNFADKTERVLDRKSLRSVQRGLGNSELLLSFYLGAEKSFVWAVTNTQVKLYQLPQEATLKTHAEAFSEMVRKGRNSVDAGRLLSQELFSQLDKNFWQRTNWLIVGDGALLNGVPFSALPEPSRSGATYLSESHRLRFVPTAAMVGVAAVPSGAATPEFVGVADPIYNLADSRRSHSRLFVNAAHTKTRTTLGRLVGSDREVRIAAQTSGLSNTRFLIGSDANSADLRTVLSASPEIIHFAVHVVSPEGRPEEAALALNLTGSDMPELLTPETIAALRVPGSLVVLSGCSSQQGKTVPSAGLVGLSRAWLLAGASAVVVSAWPTPDDSGHFFSSFYSHLEAKSLTSASLPGRAAAALQMAQLDMQRGGGYRSSPSFWAAYSIISKE